MIDPFPRIAITCVPRVKMISSFPSPSRSASVGDVFITSPAVAYGNPGNRCPLYLNASRNQLPVESRYGTTIALSDVPRRLPTPNVPMCHEASPAWKEEIRAALALQAMAMAARTDARNFRETSNFNLQSPIFHLQKEVTRECGA